MTPPSPAEAALTALAQAVGAHALEAFGVALLVLLLAVAGLGASARRVAERRRHPPSPLGRTALRLGLGFSMIIGAAVLFAALADEIGANESLGRIDQAFSDAVRQSTPPAALQASAVVTHLGDPWMLALLCAVVAGALWLRGERLLAFAYLAAVGGNALLNPALKRIFERVRPLHEGGLPLADGWSFPSGHSSSALVAYGMLAYVLLRTLPRGWHLPAVLAATATAFCVGASRIFLQVHFASDVAAGFASGTAWLGACILSVEWARGRRR